MITRIHVNQFNIKHNNKKPDNPKKVLTVKNYKSNVYTNEVHIKDDNGKVIAKVVYSPDKPLSCGAKVWIETDSGNVELIGGKHNDHTNRRQ